MKPLFPIIFIVGPTAVGKTEVSLRLAEELDAEIVSCDSMQVYREIDVATSKPTKAQQARIAHHLLSVVSVREPFDVARYNQLAVSAIEDILKRKKSVLVVGGSGLYMQVLLDGIFDKGIETPGIRQDLEDQAKELGVGVLYDKLQTLDPQAAKKIHRHDARRIIRALEVYYATQTPISQWQQQRSGLWEKFPIRLFCFDRRREQLYDRINQRVELMFKEGLLDEIKSLAKVALSRTAERIIGVQEVMGYVRGEIDLTQAKELMKMHTRRLAKRQLTWFRKEQRLEWIPLQDESAQQTANHLLHLIKRASS